MRLVQGHYEMRLVRLEPGAPGSRVKQSITALPYMTVESFTDLYDY